MANTQDTRIDRVLIRVCGPRRNYPDLLVFVDGILVFNQQTSRYTVADQVAALAANADDIAAAAYPHAAVSRVAAAAIV